MEKTDEYPSLTSDDEQARRLCSLAIAFSNAQSPLSSTEIHTTYYPDLNDDSFRKKFSRDREKLVECGLVVLSTGQDERGSLWQADVSSFADSSSISADDALMLDVLCTQLVADPTFAYREELRLALAKIDHAFGALTAARLTPAQHEVSVAMKTMLSCMEHGHLASISYIDAKGARSERSVAPYGHFGLRGNNYFVCAQEDPSNGQQLMRTLRVDRIMKARETATTFAVPEDFSVDDYIVLPFQLGPTRVTARLAVTSSTDSDDLADLDRRASTDADGVRTVGVNDLMAAARWSLAAGVRPLAPTALVETCQSILREAQTTQAAATPAIERRVLPKIRGARGRRGGTSEMRELVALVGSLRNAGASLTVEGVSARLGITPERARLLINLLLTACTDTNYQLPLWLDGDDSVILSRTQGVTGRPIRLTQAEARALVYALDDLGFEDDDPLRIDVLAAFGPSTLTEQDVMPRVDSSLSREENATLEACSRAISARSGLTFVYHGVEKAAGVRRVAPQGLRLADEFWYLDAYDLKRRALRTFRLDRMEDIRVLALPQEELAQIDAPRAERQVEVTLHDPTLLDTLEWPRLHVIGSSGTALITTLPYYGGTWLPRHLAACGEQASTSDEELAQLIRAIAADTLAENAAAEA